MIALRNVNNHRHRRRGRRGLLRLLVPAKLLARSASSSQPRRREGGHRSTGATVSPRWRPSWSCGAAACEARPRVLRRGGARGRLGASRRRRVRPDRGISGAAALRGSAAGCRGGGVRGPAAGAPPRRRPRKATSPVRAPTAGAPGWGRRLRPGVSSGPAAGDLGTTRSGRMVLQ